MSRRRLRSATWLAALAMALHALWPLLVHAKPGNAPTLVPVCTVEGVTHYIELPAGKTPLEDQSAAHHDHCAFCFSGAERSALVSQPAAVFVGLEAAGDERSRFFPLAPKDSYFFPVHARAPPFLPMVSLTANYFGRNDEKAFACERHAGAIDAASGGSLVRLGVLHR